MTVRGAGLDYLVVAFAATAAAQGAIVAAGGDAEVGNEHFRRRVEIYRELKRQDSVASLGPLLDQPDPWVRVAAAWALLEFVPERAEAILEAAGTLSELVGIHARTTLREWRAGRVRHPEAAP